LAGTLYQQTTAAALAATRWCSYSEIRSYPWIEMDRWTPRWIDMDRQGEMAR